MIWYRHISYVTAISSALESFESNFENPYWSSGHIQWLSNPRLRKLLRSSAQDKVQKVQKLACMSRKNVNVPKCSPKWNAKLSIITHVNITDLNIRDLIPSETMFKSKKHSVNRVQASSIYFGMMYSLEKHPNHLSVTDEDSYAVYFCSILLTNKPWNTNNLKDNL